MSERKAWEVYEIDGEFYFDAGAAGELFPRQTFGPYEEKDRADVELVECEAMWG